MAKHWKKLGDKLGSPVKGPSAADWAAMEQMIASKPALQSKLALGLTAKTLLLSLVALLVVGSIWFINAGGEAKVLQNLPAQNSNNTQAPISAAPSHQTTPTKESNSTGETAPENNSAITLSSPANMADEINESQTKSASKPAIVPSWAAASKADNKLSAPNAINSQKQSENASADEQKAPDQEKGSSNAALAAGGNQSVDNQKTINPQAAVAAQKSEIPSLEQALVNKEQTASSEENNSDGTSLPNNFNQDKSTADNFPPNSIVDQAEKLAVESPTETDSVKQELAPSEREVPEKPAAEEDFIDRATGFKLQSINLAFGAATNFAQPAGFGMQAALDFQWNRDNWFFQGGFSLSQDYRQQEYNVLQNQLLIDSTWTLNINSRPQAIISRIWVIDSFNAGHYEIDTTFQTVIDTSIVLNVDSSDYQISYPKTRQIRFQYAELPLLYGYQKQLGAWSLSLAAGVSVQQALAINDENYSRTEAFSLALVVQPAISYKISQQWSVFTRIRIQEQVLENRLFQTNQSPYSCQLGVSYRW